jgi:hypothetical protein
MIKVNKPFFLNWAYGLQQEGTADGARDFLLKIIRNAIRFSWIFSLLDTISLSNHLNLRKIAIKNE